MTGFVRRKMWWLLVGGLGAGLLVIALALGPEQVCCLVQSIDVNSGRYREERYIAMVRVTARVEDSAIAAMYRDVFPQVPDAEWRTVNRFRCGASVSPHYAFHSAFAGCELVVQALSHQCVSDDTRRTVLSRFFRLLQSNDNDRQAGSYAHAVWERAMDVGRTLQPDGTCGSLDLALVEVPH